ncbi:MAG: MG2 domain-containing protein [Leptospiraceae bacterium]|nr:MG2 domain-containing protein [Leptospiraceae bacterium]
MLGNSKSHSSWLFLYVLISHISPLELQVPKIFRQEETPEIFIYTYPTGKVHLRVYRVENPVDFLLKQDKELAPQKLSSLRRASSGFAMWQAFAENLRYCFYSMARSYIRPTHREALRKFLHLKSYAYPYHELFPEENLFGKLPLPLVKEWSLPMKPHQGYMRRLSVPISDTGFYLLEASHGNSIVHAPLIKSNLNLLVKEGVTSRLVYALDRRGNRLDEAELFVFSRQGELPLELVGQKKVKEGIFHEKDSDIPISGETLYLLKYKGEYVLSDIYYYLRSTQKNYRAAIFTDRPLYRPGHTVIISGLVYKHDKEVLTPYETTAELTVKDPEENTILTRHINLEASGNFTTNFVLPQHSPLGVYVVTLQIHGKTEYTQFYVEEYRKSSFYVKIEPLSSVYLHQDTARVKIKAAYYSQEPLANATVQYEIQKASLVRPFWTFFRYSWYYDDGSSYIPYEPILEGEGKTNEAGELEISFKVESVEDADTTYQVVAHVTGITRETVRSALSIPVSRSEYRLFLEQDRWYYFAGEKARFVIRAENVLKQEAQAGLRINVEFFHVSYLGDQERYEKISETTVVTNEEGEALATHLFGPKEGHYEVRISATDAHNRTTMERFSFWVYSQNGFPSYAQEEIQLLPDKTKYTPHDTIKLKINSPSQEAEKLIVFEAEDILGFEILPPGKSFVEIKIRDVFMPNFVITAHALHNDRFYYGTKQIVVPPEHKFLQVEILPNSKKYQPKEKAELSLRIRDAMGKPVQAHFFLAVVDEAIFALKSPAFSHLGEVFYPKRGHLVYTTDSSAFRLYASSRKISLYTFLKNPKERYLGEFKKAALAQELNYLRTDFRDTAFFKEGRTNENGLAKIHFDFPDNLTLWRITVHAATRHGEFGTSVVKVPVGKDFSIRFALPRFVRENDTAVVGVILNNRHGQKLKASLAHKVEGAEFVTEPPKELILAPSSQMRYDLTLQVADLSRYEKLKLTVSAQAMESDALEQEIPILPSGIRRTLSSQKIFRHDEKSGRLLLKTENKDKKIVEISAISGVLGTVEESLPYLMAYPYGCVEQTLSRFLPLQYALYLSQKLKIPYPVPQEEVDKMVKMGLQKLYQYQHDDGGWGWWHFDETNLYMTAYVLDALYQAKIAGIQLDNMVIEKAVNALAQMLRNEFGLSKSREEVIYGYLVLSLYKKLSGQELAILENYASQASAKTYLLALLAQHAARLGQKRLFELSLQKLLERQKSTASGIFFEENSSESYRWYGDTLEATAHALLAIRNSANHMRKLGEEIVLYLLSRKQHRYWNNTRTTSLLVRALGEYALYTREKRALGQITLYLNNEPIVIEQRALGQNYFSWKKELREANLEIRFERTESGLFYLRAQASFFQKNPPPTSGLFNLERQYYLLERVGEEEISYRLSPKPQKSFHVGELVASVQLFKAKQSYEYLIVEDFHPAGFEPVPYLLPYLDKRFLDNVDAHSGREIFDDRTVTSKREFFGESTWYIVQIYRAQYPGRYLAAASQGGMMYYPEHNSYTSYELISIEE